jgi:hypothetical protein
MTVSAAVRLRQIDDGIDGGEVETGAAGFE